MWSGYLQRTQTSSLRTSIGQMRSAAVDPSCCRKRAPGIACSSYTDLYYAIFQRAFGERPLKSLVMEWPCRRVSYS